tara:strand:+ start:477 stop:722 length:246 start_codon:yes stop_codon:yes gene_type:complete
MQCPTTCGKDLRKMPGPRANRFCTFIRTPHALIVGMKRLILWGALIVGTGIALALTSCAGLKVSLETELDANAGGLLNLFE